MGSGQFKLDASIDPFSARPTFDLDAQIEGLKLTNLNVRGRNHQVPEG